jgi:hypothetical protein
LQCERKFANRSVAAGREDERFAGTVECELEDNDAFRLLREDAVDEVPSAQRRDTVGVGGLKQGEMHAKSDRFELHGAHMPPYRMMGFKRASSAHAAASHAMRDGVRRA